MKGTTCAPHESRACHVSLLMPFIRQQHWIISCSSWLLSCLVHFIVRGANFMRWRCFINSRGHDLSPILFVPHTWWSSLGFFLDWSFQSCRAHHRRVRLSGCFISSFLCFDSWSLYRLWSHVEPFLFVFPVFLQGIAFQVNVPFHQKRLINLQRWVELLFVILSGCSPSR